MPSCLFSNIVEKYQDINLLDGSIKHVKLLIYKENNIFIKTAVGLKNY